MLVLFYFYELGYSPFAIASLFLFYEVFGIVTNLVGGWLAARLRAEDDALRRPGHPDRRALRCWRFAPEAWLVVPYVMAAQALSGIAKDLTKMSSKSAIKLVVPGRRAIHPLPWVAILTGSKNALKGVGFFLGGLLLTLVGFQHVAADPGRRWSSPPWSTVLVLMHGRPRARRTQGQVQPHVLQQPRGQRPRRGADLPVRLARRLVRRRPAGLPRHACSAGASGRSAASWRSG